MEDAGAPPRRESLLDVVLGELQRKGRGEPVGRLLYAARTRGNADDGGKALAEFHRRALQRAGEADGAGGDAGGLLVAFPNVILHVVEGAPGLLTALLRVIAEDDEDENGLLRGARVLAVRPLSPPPSLPLSPPPPPPPPSLPSDMHPTARGGEGECAGPVRGEGGSPDFLCESPSAASHISGVPPRLFPPPPTPPRSPREELLGEPGDC